MKHIILDTNVILRFLRGDDPSQSPQAAALFGEAVNGGCALMIGWHVVAESVWALRHHYDAPREGIATHLSNMIAAEAVVCDDKPAVLDALQRYGSTKLDIVDCLLASSAAAGGDDLATFDQGIGKNFSDITFWDWLLK